MSSYQIMSNSLYIRGITISRVIIALALLGSKVQTMTLPSVFSEIPPLGETGEGVTTPPETENTPNTMTTGHSLQTQPAALETTAFLTLPEVNISNFQRIDTENDTYGESGMKITTNQTLADDEYKRSLILSAIIGEIVNNPLTREEAMESSKLVPSKQMGGDIRPAIGVTKRPLTPGHTSAETGELEISESTTQAKPLQTSSVQMAKTPSPTSTKIPRLFPSLESFSVTHLALSNADESKQTASLVDVSPTRGPVSKSRAASISRRRTVSISDRQTLSRILLDLQDVRQKVNIALEIVCSNITSSDLSDHIGNCLSYARESGLRPAPCNGSLTHTLVDQNSTQKTLRNAALVSVDLQKLLQSVVNHYIHFYGSELTCRGITPHVVEHSRCLIGGVKSGLQAITEALLDVLGLTQIQDSNHVTCQSDFLWGKKFPLGVLWRTEEEMNLLIDGLRGVLARID